MDEGSHYRAGNPGFGISENVQAPISYKRCAFLSDAALEAVIQLLRFDLCFI